MPIALLPMAALLLATAGCEEPIPGGIEHVIDGGFDHWPSTQAQGGDAWKLSGSATLSVPQSTLRLVIRTSGDEAAGTQTQIPVTPDRDVQLTLRHRGGAGRLELDLDEDGEPWSMELPASDGWTTVETDLLPTRDGIALRLLDHPGDDRALKVDDVSLTESSPGDSRYEPPIRILLVIHAKSPNDEETYWQRRGDLEQIVALAESHDLRLTLLLNGPFAEWAVNLEDGAYYAQLLERGHEIGTHIEATFQEAHVDWEAADMFDDGVADREWGDHRRWVDELVDPLENTTTAAYAPVSQMAALMATHGFELDLSSAAINVPDGNSREAVPWHYLGHHPHHPFRPADSVVEGQELQGDTLAPYVTITHAAQVGRSDAHGAPCDEEDYRRLFQQQLRRWTAHQRAATTDGRDRVWVFGIAHHLGQHDDRAPDLEALLDSLDELALSAVTDEGNPVATGATGREVLEEYRQWEVDHPEEPGFSFTLPR